MHTEYLCLEWKKWAKRLIFQSPTNNHSPCSINEETISHPYQNLTILWFSCTNLPEHGLSWQKNYCCLLHPIYDLNQYKWEHLQHQIIAVSRQRCNRCVSQQWTWSKRQFDQIWLCHGYYLYSFIRHLYLLKKKNHWPLDSKKYLGLPEKVDQLCSSTIYW